MNTAKQILDEHRIPVNGNPDLTALSDKAILEAMKEYAEEAIKECIKQARVVKTGNTGSWYDASIDRQSIIDFIKELK